MYIPPGRKFHNRNELAPKEDEIILGPPIIDNNDLTRQRFAIKDYLRTLRGTILLHDVNSKQMPSEAVKPAIKSSFFIKEQRWKNPLEFVEPDDEALKSRDAGKHLQEYMETYRKNPHFVERSDRTSKALKAQLNKKIPLPGYARMQLNVMRKIDKERQLKEQNAASALDKKDKSMTDKAGRRTQSVPAS